MQPREEVAYGVFARFYDELMVEAVDYPRWFAGLQQLCREHGETLTHRHRVLDLACGTGLMTREMAKAGYRVTGADLSEDMLAVAEQRLRAANSEVQLLRADMRELDLGISFDCVFCLCDSLNYLDDTRELRQAFSSVDRALRAGGLFVFDVNTEYKLRHTYGNNTYAEIRDGWSYIWENTYDPKQRLCQMDLAFYVQDSDGRFTEYTERHYETAFSHREITLVLQETGFDLLGVYGDDLRSAPTPGTQRITYIAANIGGTGLDSDSGE